MMLVWLSSDFPWFNFNDLWKTYPWISFNAAKHQQAKQKQKKMEIPAMKTQRPQQKAQSTSCTSRPSCLPCPQQAKDGGHQKNRCRVSGEFSYFSVKPSQHRVQRDSEIGWSCQRVRLSNEFGASIQTESWEYFPTTWFQCFSYAFSGKGLPVISANKHSMAWHELQMFAYTSLCGTFFSLCGSLERGQQTGVNFAESKNESISHIVWCMATVHDTAFVGLKAGHLIRWRLSRLEVYTAPGLPTNHIVHCWDGQSAEIANKKFHTPAKMPKPQVYE